MFRICCGALLSTLLLMTSISAQGELQKKKVEISKKWNGSVDDEKAMQPVAITTAAALEAVWKAWKAPGDVPKVDFATDIVVAVYSPGSKLSIAGASLDEKGNLDVLGFGTRDLRPGFRYVLGVVSKEGIKTVNGKELPK
jgi:hypothetical protein